jgi:hypothetical protein
MGSKVDPPEEDSPDLIEEAVRLALEKDPLVNAGQIKVGARKTWVRLRWPRLFGQIFRFDKWNFCRG